MVRDLHAAGYWTMIGSALGSVPAVFSGLLMTKGSVLGHGALRMHHLFVWPAFALIIATCNVARSGRSARHAARVCGLSGRRGLRGRLGVRRGLLGRGTDDRAEMNARIPPQMKALGLGVLSRA